MLLDGLHVAAGRRVVPAAREPPADASPDVPRPVRPPAHRAVEARPYAAGVVIDVPGGALAVQRAHAAPAVDASGVVALDLADAERAEAAVVGDARPRVTAHGLPPVRLVNENGADRILVEPP